MKVFVLGILLLAYLSVKWRFEGLGRGKEGCSKNAMLKHRLVQINEQSDHPSYHICY